MKVLIISTCLAIMCQLSVLSNDNTSMDMLYSKNENVSKSSFMVKTGTLLKQAYAFLNDNVDYLLTTKGVTKTMAVLAPFVVMYGRWFGLDPIKEVARDLLRNVGRAQAFYELQKTIGANEQLLEEIATQPWKMFGIATVELVKSIAKKIKVPYIS